MPFDSDSKSLSFHRLSNELYVDCEQSYVLGNFL